MPAPSSVTLLDFGEDAVIVNLGIEDAPDRAARTHAAARALRARLPACDLVVGAGVVLVVLAEGATRNERNEIKRVIAEGELDKEYPSPPPRVHLIRAVYDGPDLQSAANALGMSTDELIKRHTEQETVAELIGFLPGFAYLGPIDSRIVLPRRPSPRPLVPAGSIGIAGTFTGIYPFSSPGGWNLIGRAPDVALFDPAQDPPCLVQPGDRVRFIADSCAVELSGARAPAPAPPRSRDSRDGSRGIVVVSTQIGVTVQDLGRPGQLSRGLPPSGPLDPEAFAAANEAVDNPPSSAAIEIPLGSLEIEARGRIVVSINGAKAVTLADGERLSVPATESAVQYLALAGGVDVPMVLGARATLLVARIGGVLGRPLRRGDFVGLCDLGKDGTVSTPERTESARSGEDEIIEIVPGPHLARFPSDAFEVLVSTRFQISRLGDRVGVRLEGGRIPREGPDLALPFPMRRGAIQVTTDGTPIILGPDHPITGGYPVLAVVRRASWGKLARKRPGCALRFRAAR